MVQAGTVGFLMLWEPNFPSVNTNSDPSTIHCYACAGQICEIPLNR